MALTAAELVKADQEHLIHPLHHPTDNAEPTIYVRGRGATVTDIGGAAHPPGPSRPWNVNRGPARAPREGRPGRGPLREDVRAAGARLRARADLLPVPPAGGPAGRERWAGGGARDRGGDPARGARHGRRP